MYEAFDAFFQFDKGAEIGQFGYAAFYDIVYVVFFFKMQPRIFIEVFKRQIDALFGRIQADNLERNLLSFFDEILRPGYVSPAHIVYMQQSVETAQIDKGAEACKAFYRAGYRVADRYAVEKSVAFFFNRFFQIFASVYDHIRFVVGIQTFHIKFAFFAEEFFGIFNLLAIRLADRQKGAYVAAQIDFKTAFDGFFYGAFNRRFILKSLPQIFPQLFYVGFLL